LVDSATSWPDTIVDFFDLAKIAAEKSTFYGGSYNALLNYLFPFEQGYMVVPQLKRSEQSKAVDFTADFTAVFVVLYAEHPIFFLEVKGTNKLFQMSTRQAADQQMREQFYNLFDDLQINVLYGVSAFDTQLCLYTLARDTGRIEPDAIHMDPNYVIDTAPEERWGIDLLTTEGEQLLRQVVTHIEMMLEGDK